MQQQLGGLPGGMNPLAPPQQNNTMIGMGMVGEITDLAMFGQSFTNLEELDIFKPEGDLDFEREFALWFNGPEDGGGSGLESMK